MAGLWSGLPYILYMPEKTLEWMRGLFAPARSKAAAQTPSGETALVALLVRAARANDDYDSRQIAAIDAVMGRRFAQGPFEGAALRRKAEALEAATGDTVHLTRAIKDILPLEERPALLEDLWEVILADGKRHDAESGMMRLVSNLLGLNDRDSAFARQRVERRERSDQQ